MGLKPLRQRPGKRGAVSVLDAESGRWTLLGILGECGSKGRGGTAEMPLGANRQPAGHVPSVKFLSKKKPHGS